MNVGPTHGFKGASGTTYQFTVFAKNQRPEGIPGIFIYAKKLFFDKNKALFLIPLIIKPSLNMASTLRMFRLSDHEELEEVDYFCVLEEADKKKRDAIYQDLLAKYDEGKMEAKSEKFKT